MLKLHFALCACALLGFSATLAVPWPVRLCPQEPQVVGYRADLPNIECLAGRVVAESRGDLTAAQRGEIWSQYGLAVGFEWVAPDSGFTYHELEVRPWSLLDRALACLTRTTLAPRGLPELIAQLNDDPRVNWAAPDALLLEWSDQPVASDGPAASVAAGVAPAVQEIISPGGTPGATGDGFAGYGVTLLDEQYRSFAGSLDEWAQHADWPAPLPDFEYYRLCAPEGTPLLWATELAASATFAERYPRAFGVNQALALERYEAAGSPALQSVTVCVADTGMFLNHPDFAGRLHANAIDANYRNYVVAAVDERAAPESELSDRGAANATGLPRPAIKGQPSWHGTAVAGEIARCTAGFMAADGQDAVRLLAASVKSERTFAISGTRIKSPISAFIKLIACLSEQFPVGGADILSADAGSAPLSRPPIANDGDVRVVSVSASVPKSFFSETEWRVVANIAGKAAGAIAEDLRLNDRVYVFASGNDAQPEPNKPCEMDYVLAVTASMAFDGAAAWQFPPSGEGANMGQKCVAAPGWGIITSCTYPHPNLAYLPEGEVPQPRENQSTPRRAVKWVQQTNRFSATSSATPQVSALAALLYAQDGARGYRDVISAVEASCAERTVSAPWGQARGLIDYATALGW